MSVWLAELAVQFAFWGAIAFMVGYTAVAKWWKSPIGWARISLDAGIALALSPSELHFLVGLQVEQNPFFYWYTILAVFLVGCVSLWNLVLVVRVQVKGTKKGSS